MNRHQADETRDLPPLNSRSPLPRARARATTTAVTLLGLAGILVACLSVVWNLASLGLVANLQRSSMQREHSRRAVAAQERAREMENEVVWVQPPTVSSGTAVALAGCVTLFSLHLLLAGVLFAGAVGLLRGSPRARSTHLSYAYVKIPLSILAGVAWMWILGRDGQTRNFSYVWAPLAVVVGCAYPLFLVMFFRDPTPRAAATAAA